ncbi:MAG: glucosidase family protein [Armatimonadota bacterium]
MQEVTVLWKDGPQEGAVEVSYGRMAALSATGGTVDGVHFTLTGDTCRLQITIDEENLGHGANPTMVTVRSQVNPFTFLLRDVDRTYPLYIPAYGVAVTGADDQRTYAEIAGHIQTKKLQTSLQQIATEQEESYVEAAVHTRDMQPSPTWLGLSRDIRIFYLEYLPEGYWHQIRPHFHGYPAKWPEGEDKPISFGFQIARGMGCEYHLTRRLEEGVLPILHATARDGGITYHTVSFASLETSPLTLETLRGTHFLVADGHGAGFMFTEAQQIQFDQLKATELQREEEVVLYQRTEATNSADVPRYAWYKIPSASCTYTYDGSQGIARLSSGRVFLVSKLNGQPMPQEEVAVLLKPGETATFDCCITHQPIAEERAIELAKQDFSARHRECRDFWWAKLMTAAKVHVPEQRINEMVRAGLLHLDLVTYGFEPDGPTTATIGVYCPIGSESSPIIQMMDSMGWTSLAERSLQYFLEKQHDDGFMQNFGGYMLETGAALWCMGEHYRYTRDDAWLRKIAPKLIKSCEYILSWRQRNMREELRGRGYGLIDGKVADPEDAFHAFMNNGYAYLGLQRVSEMLANVDPDESARWAREAASFKADIRQAFFDVLAISPVVPLGDGTWCPTMAPWAEGRGPVSLFTDGLKWFTHGSFFCRDSLIGPNYLGFQEVLDSAEEGMSFILEYQADLMHMRNVAFAQPYYSPHAWLHLRRGEVKAFLKVYYNGFAGLADRETYSFWEHYFHASPHKTHEEGWFLMQTRWMLYMERGDTLELLPGIPRAWLEQGKRISLDNVASYFGPLSLEVTPELEQGRITAFITCEGDRKPARVLLRLPHPDGRKPSRVTGGVYQAAQEAVLVESFTGKAQVCVEFSFSERVASPA